MATGATTLLRAQSAAHERVVDLTFPIAGPVEFADDYDAGRGDGSRAHRATDLFASAGTAVHAVRGGTVSWVPGRHPTAGYALHVRGDDGLLYAYYHLGPHGGPATKAYAPGVAEGSAVRRGQLIGYVGDSGNAAGGRPHLHLEIHDGTVVDPYGTNRLNPYPSLVDARRRGDHPRAPSPAGARAETLRRGDRGTAVAAWQSLLNTVRPTPISVDGDFGPETDRATRDFQASAGIPVDGIVGPQTRAAMSDRTTPDDARLLRKGDRGPDVAAWQSLLNTVRPTPISVDGDFGPETDRATRDFQASAGIPVDGIVGPQTRVAIGG